MSVRPLVFFSHARKDIALVQRVVAETRAAALETWMDVERLRPGDRWREAVRDAIGACDLFVCCVSESSLDSLWTGGEIATALEHGKPLLPLLLSPIAARRLPDALRDFQALEISGLDAPSAARAAARAIAAAVGAQPPGAQEAQGLEIWSLDGGGRAHTVRRLADLDALQAQPVARVLVHEGSESAFAAAAITLLASEGRPSFTVCVHHRHLALAPLVQELGLDCQVLKE